MFIPKKKKATTVYRLSQLTDRNPIRLDSSNNIVTTPADSTSTTTAINSSLAKFTTAATTLSTTQSTTNENVSSSVLTRPTTALFKVLEKMSFNMPHFSTTDNGKLVVEDPDSASTAKSTQPKQQPDISAADLEAKINRILKFEQKSLVAREELVKDFQRWAAILPNSESSTTIKIYSDLLKFQKNGDAELFNRLSQLKTQLASVNEREKKQKELIEKQNKILRDIKENEVKYGHDATQTALQREALEENIYSLEIVELQVIRAITDNLKTGLLNYTTGFHSISMKNMAQCTQFIDHVMADPDSARAPRKPTGRENSGAIAMHNNRKEFQPASLASLSTLHNRDLVEEPSAQNAARREGEPIRMLNNDRSSSPDAPYRNHHRHQQQQRYEVSSEMRREHHLNTNHQNHEEARNPQLPERSRVQGEEEQEEVRRAYDDYYRIQSKRNNDELNSGVPIHSGEWT